MFAVFCTCGQGIAAATTQPLSQQSSVDEILDALDASGKSMSDFVADVKLATIDNGTGDTTVHDGQVLFQKKGQDDGRVKIIFNQKEDGNKLRPMDHRYVLDNGQLIERDYDAKRETIRQVLKPGQKLNLLKLGEGPFPLPIGQKKEDVKAQFDITKIDPAKDDVPGTIHLQLIPKPDSTFAKKFATINIWVDPATAMPRRIETQDHNQAETRRTDLTNLKLNQDLKDKDFVEPELPPGWDTSTERYGE